MTTTMTKRPASRRTKTAPIPEDMTLAEYIRFNCRDKRSTTRFFARCGLTWDKSGNPTVVPR